MNAFKTSLRALLLAATFAGVAHAETDTVTLGRQPGLPHLVMMIMEHDKLVEKHLAATGLPNTKVSCFCRMAARRRMRCCPAGWISRASA
jgi:NitT/TauT family transport system substrate-binding protein